MIVNTRAELETLADGTIITWLRIPGDTTSEAVAFVRIEQNPGCDQLPCPDPRCPGPTVWISPGGWQPMAIEDAGINYPVVAFSDPGAYALTAIPAMEPLPPFPTIKGGTWAREKALECACRIYGHDAVLSSLDDLLQTANAFEAWLDRPEQEQT